MEDNKQVMAQKMFEALCAFMDASALVYEKDEKELEVTVGFSGDDLPLKFTLSIDAERELFKIGSLLPFTFREDKRVEGALVTSFANYILANGCFDYSYEKGAVYFRLTTSYRDSLVSGRALGLLLAIAGDIVEKYNDKFLLVSLGAMSVDDFITWAES